MESFFYWQGNASESGISGVKTGCRTTNRFLIPSKTTKYLHFKGIKMHPNFASKLGC